MALVSRHNILLCDDHHHRVILYDIQQDKEKSYVKVAGCSWTICMLSAECAALPQGREVLFIKVTDDTLTLGERVEVAGGTAGICAINDAQLAISCYRHIGEFTVTHGVVVISKKGIVINRNDKLPGDPWPVRPTYLTVSPDHSYIFVSYRFCGVIMLTTNLQVLKVFSDKELLTSYCGITMWIDLVLICGSEGRYGDNVHRSTGSQQWTDVSHPGETRWSVQSWCSGLLSRNQDNLRSTRTRLHNPKVYVEVTAMFLKCR